MKALRILGIFVAAACTGLLFGDTVFYKDKLGRTLTVQSPVRRAVIFQLYEFLPVLDCWDSVAGISRYAYDNDLVLKAKPDIRKIPSAGNGTEINAETLLKLKPDLIVTWTYKPDTIRFMEDHGLKVAAIYPDSVAEFRALIQFYGKIFQRQQKAAGVIRHMDEIFSLVKSKASSIPYAKKKKVLWIGSRPNTVSGASGMTHELIQMLGGINAACNILQRNSDVSIETIIKWNPDVIFIWGSAKYQTRDIVNNPQWRFIKAVRDRQVFKAPEWSLWSPRLALIVLWMASKTYPDFYRAAQVQSCMEEFYKKVLGIPWSKDGFDGF